MAFTNELSIKMGEEDFVCKSRTKDVKLLTSTSQGYRIAIHYLKSKEANYHTYQLKQERGFRIVIRHLHPSTPVEAIKEELECQGFEMRNVSNAKSSRTKEPLPLFFVELAPQPNNAAIYNVQRLLHTVVKVEEPHQKADIPQCTRCQVYGHTRTYCNYDPKCVKCAGSHHTSECSKSRETPAKCVLCGGSHPANYKGCTTYSELKRKNFKRPSLNTSRQQNSYSPQENCPTLPTRPDDASSSPPQPEIVSSPTSRPSYAVVAGHRQQTASQSFIPPPSSSFGLS